jgi:hypothetical protein
VSVLKEEKRLILLQVKAGEAEKNKMVSQMKEDKLPKPVPVSLGNLTNGKINLHLRYLDSYFYTLLTDFGDTDLQTVTL